MSETLQTLSQIHASDNLIGISRPTEVILVGAGGTGSAVMSLLFQMHTTLLKLGGNGFNVTVYDSKLVSDSNVGRQSYWSSSDIGHYKASLLVNRFNQFGQVKWKYVCEKYDENAKPCDLLITAIDSASGRIEIGKILNKKTGKKNGCWMDLGNSQSIGNCIIGSQCNGNGITTAPSPLQIFGEQWSKIDDTAIKEPSCSMEQAIYKQSFGINQTLAALSFSMVLFPLVRTGSLDNFGFMFNLNTMETFPLKVNKDVWAIYGFYPNS